MSPFNQLFQCLFLANNIYQTKLFLKQLKSAFTRDEHLPAKHSQLNKKISANSQCLLILEHKFDDPHQHQIATNPLDMLFKQQVPVWIRITLDGNRNFLTREQEFFSLVMPLRILWWWTKSWEATQDSLEGATETAVWRIYSLTYLPTVPHIYFLVCNLTFPISCCSKPFTRPHFSVRLI